MTCGTTIGVIQADTRSLDYSSYIYIYAYLYSHPFVDSIWSSLNQDNIPMYPTFDLPAGNFKRKASIPANSPILDHFYRLQGFMQVLCTCRGNTQP